MPEKNSFTKNKRVLLITTDDEKIDKVKEILTPEGINVFPYRKIETVKKLLDIDPNFALIIFDYLDNKAEVDEAIKQIRQNLRFYNTPIVLLITEDNLIDSLISAEVGADDCLSLSSAPTLLQLRMRILLGLTESRNKLETKEQELHAIKAFEQITVTLSHYINNAITPLMLTIPPDDKKIDDPDIVTFVNSTKKTINYIKNVIDVLLDLTETGKANVVKNGLYRGLLIDMEKKLRELQK